MTIIFFASTIIVFSSFYFEASISRETRILSSYNALSQTYLNDNISSNLKNVMGIDNSVSFGDETVLIRISDSFPKNDLSSDLVSYKTFLEEDFFPFFPGEQSLSFTNSSNPKLFFGDLFYYSMSNSESVFYSLQESPNSIDLNIFGSGLLSSDFSSSSGDVVLNINYFDDSNSLKNFSISEKIETAYIYLEVEGSEEIIFQFTEPSFDFGVTSSLTSTEVSFDAVFDYPFTGSYLPVFFDASLSHSFRNISSDSNVTVSR